MTELLLYTLSGVFLALLMGVARGSMRRWVVGAGLALLVVFVAFPFSRARGFLSRDTIDPTLLGLTPVYPLLLLIPLGVLVALVLTRRGGAAGWGGVLGGAVVLLAAGSWYAQPAQLVRMQPINGLMELLVALGVAASVALLAFSRPKQRLPILLAAALAGALAFYWFHAPQGGGAYLPKSLGYYKLFSPTAPESQTAMIEAYNQALPELNAIRKELGQEELKPIQSLADLQGAIPQQASSEGYRLVQPATTQYGAFGMFFLAGLMLGAGLVLLRNPTLHEPDDWRAGILIALVASCLIPAFDATEFDLNKLVVGWPFLQQFADRAWPPLLADASAERYPLQEVLSQIAVTVQMALVGTFLAAVFAMPISFLAARNVTSGTPLMRSVFYATRLFLNVLRGVPTLIIALILVAAVGLGPFAGVMAIAIHSLTELGKLYSEAIENADKGPVEALESTGAAGVNVVRWAILPQVLPLFVSYTIYNFEINFRSSLVLGLVGAGGIGYFINEKMASGQYDQMIVGVIAIVVVVNIIDFASSWLRSRLV
ncbi:phosphonate ABC transporter, permease protein PhnE [Meiothermus ruber]|jgi:phosphonate ABC transporter permease subunit PhnE|uniref:Phosphonate ABC transporter permease n=1 Tax=Meiothermus ruber (strain ATCC 35948 / DSM 1279 / VKM B-1258 / 21) TaxID=504728 RepID=D3PKT1_MEIRD|nr:phosphonate ABC transporter, permease protein PhnE [Meiothermus ruber]ADD28955.1 phosphonate ABC transporter, inner membrane subunit [Meiothermus ruber DSM 1279]AGK05595.1 phosphonate ABC transporter permease [Meiothermus ruber DSM 1279]MCL6528712.1 phosphonate ABC transporter, permease protein PhnE [Meiothermus ruber]GAO75873.1 phosphonate ABC transporter permease [Meiothermus ruber H328]